MNALEDKLAQLGLTKAVPVPAVCPKAPSKAGGLHAYPQDVYEDKQKTRLGTLNLLRDPANASSLWYEGHLTCDWAEVCGDAPDDTCGFLLAEQALTPRAKFIGMNNSQGIIDRNTAAFASAADRTRWLCGQAEHLLLDLNNPDLKNVGVFVFDGFNSPANTNLANILIPILGFAEEQYHRLGQFLLVINLSLRGNSRLSLDAGIQQYEAIIREHCKTGAIPDTAYTPYTSRKARMWLLRLTYGW